MHIAMNIPSDKANFMIEMLNNFSFVENIFTDAPEKIVLPSKRKIGLLNGIGDVVFKDNWELSEEELLDVK